MPSPKFDQEIRGKGIARSSMGALAALGDIQLPVCPYDRHRLHDWRLAAGGPVVCGVCHPPAPGLEVEIFAGATP